MDFIKQHFKRLIMFAAIFVGAYLFLSGAVLAVALTVDGRRSANMQMPDLPTAAEEDPDRENTSEPFFVAPIEEEDEGSLLRPPARTNFVLLGLDRGNLADAIMVGTFYRDSGEIRFMSVPRDTHIILPEARHAWIRERGLNMPREMKINEMRAFSGRELGPQLVMQELGDMLGVSFHYYVEVQIAAFRRIVDAIGGVYFTVPRRLFYEDPFQNLVINVPAGHQRINGATAEGLVRYRGYANQDLGRITVQKEFMMALMQQVLTRDALWPPSMELIRTIIEDVRTNVSITDIPRYVPYLTRASAGMIQTFTMPGDIEMRNRQSVFLPCTTSLPDIIWDVFYADIERDVGL